MATAQTGPGDSGAAGVEDLAAGLVEDKFAYEIETAWEWMDEVKPLVEKIANRKLKRVPKLACVRRSEFRKVIHSEILERLNDFAPEGRNSVNPLVAEAQATASAASMLGKYGYQGATMYLLPGNIAPLMQVGGFDKRLLEGMIKVVIAHELVHALQDQHIGLGKRLARLRTKEAIISFNAVVEGQAVVIQDQVAARLGLEEAAAAVRKLMPGGGLLEEKYPQIAAKLDSSRINQRLIYSYGTAYMQSQWDKGGAARMWDVVAGDPVPFTDITNARETEIEGRRFSELLKGKEKLFGEGPWEIRIISVDKAAMSQQFATVEPEWRAQLVEQVQSSTAYAASGSSGGKQQMVVFSVIAVRDPEFARSFIEVNDRVFAEKIAPAKAAGMKITNPTIKLEIGNDIIGKERTLRIAAPDGTNKVEQFFTDLVQGNIILQIVTINVPLPDDFRYVDFLKGIFIDP